MEKEKVLLIRQVTQMQGWRILRDRWLGLCDSNKLEVSNRLRKPSSDNFLEATKLQGRIDGVEFVLKDVERILSEKDEPNPSY